MNASWPLFRAFRVDVRVHWSIVLVPLVLLAGLSDRLGTAQAVAWALAGTAALYVVIWTHEMGHIAAGRRFGTPFGLITLSPLGGLAHASGPTTSPRAEFWTALAGPATHLLWLAVALPAHHFLDAGSRPEEWARMLGAFIEGNVALLAFNLLPFHPLDGSRALHGVLAKRMHPNRASLLCAWLGYAGAVVVGLVGVWSVLFGADLVGRLWGPLLVAMAITHYAASRNLQREARFSDAAYEPAEPWAGDLPGDSWKQGWKEPAPDPVDREEERRERLAAEERRREKEFRRRLRERIDQLLDRINEVGGVENLSAAERRELAEASELLRREPADR